MQRPTVKETLKNWAVFLIVTSPLLVWGLFRGKEPFLDMSYGLLKFMVGDISQIQPASVSWSGIALFTVVYMTTLDVIDNASSFLFGKVDLSDSFKNEIIESPLLARITSTVSFGVVEEILFRGGFLWLVPKLLGGNFYLYALSVVNSTIFGFVHFWNYQGSNKIGVFFKILLMGIIGMINSFIFLKYGLLVACVIHGLNNIVYSLTMELL